MTAVLKEQPNQYTVSPTAQMPVGTENALVQEAQHILEQAREKNLDPVEIVKAAEQILAENRSGVAIPNEQLATTNTAEAARVEVLQGTEQFINPTHEHTETQEMVRTLQQEIPSIEGGKEHTLHPTEPRRVDLSPPKLKIPTSSELGYNSEGMFIKNRTDAEYPRAAFNLRVLQKQEAALHPEFIREGTFAKTIMKPFKGLIQFFGWAS